MSRVTAPAQRRALLKRLAGLPADSEGTFPGAAACDPGQFEKVRLLRRELETVRALGMDTPYFKAHDGAIRGTTKMGGRELIDFGAYNYLGLVGDPEVDAAAKAAIDRYGTSASASRLASGERPIHRELETAIAQFVGCEASLTFTAGYLANSETIGQLVGPRDLVVHDALIHRSVMSGAVQSGAKRLSFAHNDPDDLRRLLARARNEFDKVLVVIEGVYSMDGDVPDLTRFVQIKREFGAMLMVDEAHSIGVLGETGRGLCEHAGVPPSDVDLWMGTLSKALASCGGYIAGSRELIEFLAYTAPGFVYSAGMTPANAAAALAALRKLERDPTRVTTLRNRADQLRQHARRAGLDVAGSADGAVVPVMVGDDLTCLRLADRLGAHGINVQPIVHPAVERGRARLRFFVSALHTESHLKRAVETTAKELLMLTSDARAARERNRLHQVKSLYDALERNDQAALLEVLHPEATAHITGPSDLPFPTGIIRGKRAIAEFFATFFSLVEVGRQELQHIVIQEDRIVVIGKAFDTVRATGVTYTEHYAHLIVFRDDQVLSFADIYDTEAVAQAFRRADA